MTLCIAATCIHQKRPAIILCSDWRSESGDLAGGDVEDKLTWIAQRRWAALKAGTISDADKLAIVYRSLLSTIPMGLTKETVLPTLNTAFTHYRLMLINEYLCNSIGVEYYSLLSGVKRFSEDESEPVEFPEQFVDAKLREVESLPYPCCQLIVAGFTGEGIPIVCIVNEPPAEGSSSRIRLESNFAAIGSGASAATMALYRRQHIGNDTGLMRAIYHVYEAKLLGEVSPGVGDSTSITILFQNGECWDLSSAGHDYMAERFEYFGPMSIGKSRRRKLEPPWFSVKSKYFENYEAPWEGSQAPQAPNPAMASTTTTTAL